MRSKQEVGVGGARKSVDVIQLVTQQINRCKIESALFVRLGARFVFAPLLKPEHGHFCFSNTRLSPLQLAA